MKEYVDTLEFWNDMTVEIGGLIIEIILLSILIPFIIWIYNYKRRRFNKYHGITILFGLFDSTLGQITLLLDFDTKYKESNLFSADPTFGYWAENANELEIGYTTSPIGNLKVKLFCVEHFCEKNSSIATDKIKIKRIIESLNKIIEEYKSMQFLTINNRRIQNEINGTKALIYSISGMLQNYKDKSDDVDIIELIHNSTLMMMHLFYKHARFLQFYNVYSNLGEELFDRDYSKKRDEFLSKIRSKEAKEKKRNQFWSDLFLLFRLWRYRKK